MGLGEPSNQDDRSPLRVISARTRRARRARGAGTRGRRARCPARRGRGTAPDSRGRGARARQDPAGRVAGSLEPRAHRSLALPRSRADAAHARSVRSGPSSGTRRRAGLNTLAALANSLRQPASLRDSAHRTSPLPTARPWVMGQSWERLAFLHWPVDADALAAVLPPAVEPDVYEGSAWIGVTPFEVHSFRLRMTLPIPFISTFPEINVRTYVTSAGKPGIWFLSLDSSSHLAVLAARRSYRLPYHHASRGSRRRDGWIEFASEREDAVFAARYRPTGPV